jgi:peroxin-14
MVAFSPCVRSRQLICNPQMIDKHAQAQASSLQELQAELKSLRTLLMARNKPLASPSAIASSAGRPSSPFAAPTQSQQGESEISMAANALLAPRVPAAAASGATDAPRPSIPAWQLAASSTSRPATPASDDAKQTVDSKSAQSSKTDGKKASE